MLESKFQSDLIKDLQDIFPGCLVIKLDPNYIQGIPDLLVLHGKHWAVLECKQHSRSRHQPNQDWYIDTMNEMSFGAFIFPENKEEILDEIQLAFRASR